MTKAPEEILMEAFPRITEIAWLQSAITYFGKSADWRAIWQAASPAEKLAVLQNAIKHLEVSANRRQDQIDGLHAAMQQLWQEAQPVQVSQATPVQATQAQATQAQATPVQASQATPVSPSQVSARCPTALESGLMEAQHSGATPAPRQPFRTRSVVALGLAGICALGLAHYRYLATAIDAAASVLRLGESLTREAEARWARAHNPHDPVTGELYRRSCEEKKSIRGCHGDAFFRQSLGGQADADKAADRWAGLCLNNNQAASCRDRATLCEERHEARDRCTSFWNAGCDLGCGDCCAHAAAARKPEQGHDETPEQGLEIDRLLSRGCQELASTAACVDLANRREDRHDPAGAKAALGPLCNQGKGPAVACFGIARLTRASSPKDALPLAVASCDPGRTDRYIKGCSLAGQLLQDHQDLHAPEGAALDFYKLGCPLEGPDDPQNPPSAGACQEVAARFYDSGDARLRERAKAYAQRACQLLVLAREPEAAAWCDWARRISDGRAPG